MLDELENKKSNDMENKKSNDTQKTKPTNKKDAPLDKVESTQKKGNDIIEEYSAKNSTSGEDQTLEDLLKREEKIKTKLNGFYEGLLKHNNHEIEELIARKNCEIEELTERKNYEIEELTERKNCEIQSFKTQLTVTTEKKDSTIKSLEEDINELKSTVVTKDFELSEKGAKIDCLENEKNSSIKKLEYLSKNIKEKLVTAKGKATELHNKEVDKIEEAKEHISESIRSMDIEGETSMGKAQSICERWEKIVGCTFKTASALLEVHQNHEMTITQQMNSITAITDVINKVESEIEASLLGDEQDSSHG